MTFSGGVATIIFIFAVLNAVSLGLIAGANWMLSRWAGWSPFAVSGTEILIGAVLLGLLYNEMSEEDRRIRRGER